MSISSLRLRLGRPNGTGPDPLPDPVTPAREPLPPGGILALFCLLLLLILLVQIVSFATGPLAELHQATIAAAADAPARTADLQPTLSADPAGVRTPEGRPAEASPLDNEISLAQRHHDRGRVRMAALAAAAVGALYVLLIHRRRVRTRGQLSNTVMILMFGCGSLMLASRLFVQPAIPGYAAWGILDVVLLQSAAAVLIPWSARESILSSAALLIIWSVTFLVPAGARGELMDRLVGVIVSPLALATAAMFCDWRRRRREDIEERKRLDRRVELMGGELSRARIVHDAMFPRPFHGAPIALDYGYEPIQEIGGDYVHVYRHPESGVTMLTMLDVAGHGLAAALTVNRLFGELERILAEHPDATPHTVIALLNRYIHLTMSAHSLFATGACLRLDPATGELTWVNAGHPPAIVRHLDSRTTSLPSTTFLLGVVGSDEFDPCEQRMRLRPGETLIVYTDGAFEARSPRGECFGLRRIEELLSFDPPPRSWPRFIASAVAEHHCGNAGDDVLIASLTLTALRVGGGGGGGANMNTSTAAGARGGPESGAAAARPRA